MYYSVDRIEHTVAVLEDEQGAYHTVPLSSLPDGIAETDVLDCQNGEWQIDTKETTRRREHARRLQERLRRI